jgi:hypothetical protein
MRKNPAVIIGGCIVMAAIIHAWLCSRPILTGHLKGSLVVNNQVFPCDGCKVECYESFVVVYIKKDGNWLDSFI